MTLTLALTTPLPPTGGARSLPRSSSASRQDLCSPGRSARREIGRWCHLPSIAPTSKVAGWWKVYLVGGTGNQEWGESVLGGGKG